MHLVRVRILQILMLGCPALVHAQGTTSKFTFTPTFGNLSYSDYKAKLSTPLADRSWSFQIRRTQFSASTSEWAEKAAVQFDLDSIQTLEPFISLSQGTGVDHSFGLGVDYSLNLNEIDSTLLLGLGIKRFSDSTDWSPSIGFEHALNETWLLGVSLSASFTTFDPSPGTTTTTTGSGRRGNSGSGSGGSGGGSSGSGSGGDGADDSAETSSAALLGSSSEPLSRTLTLYASAQVSDQWSIDPSLSFSRAFSGSTQTTRTLALAATCRLNTAWEISPEITRSTTPGQTTFYTAGVATGYRF